MKRIISILTVMCIIFTMFATVVSADSDEVKITSVTYTSSGNVYTLNVHGLCAEGTNVSLVVKNQGGTLRAIEQCKATYGDTFEKEIYVNVSADNTDPSVPVVYTLVARNYMNKSTQYTITLYTEAQKQDIIDTYFKPAALDNSTEDMMTAISSYSSVFGFNMEYYSAMDEEIAENMIDAYKDEAFTASNINLSYENSVIRAYLFNEDTTADRTNIIEDAYYSEILGFEDGFDGTESLYSDYAAMDDSDKAAVNALVFADDNKDDDFDTLKEKFFMGITSQVFESNEADYQAIYNFLLNHNDWFELKKIDSLSKAQVSRIIGGLVDEVVPADKEGFAELYDKHYNKVTGENKEVTKPSTGGTGGGGGGGTGPIISDVGEGGYEPAPEVQKPVVAPVNKLTFDDLKDYAWASDAIYYLAGEGVVNGRGNNMFAPADSVTREEFAKILVLTYGLYDADAECEFSDVPEDRWSYKYVASLYNSGAVTGYGDGSFGVGNLITREEMAVMMCRILVRQSKVDMEYGTYTAFGDFEDISEFAVNSVLVLGFNGIISGDDAGNFNPQKGASRAEACQMIYNSVAVEGGINND